MISIISINYIAIMQDIVFERFILLIFIKLNFLKNREAKSSEVA